MKKYLVAFIVIFLSILSLVLLQFTYQKHKTSDILFEDIQKSSGISFHTHPILLQSAMHYTHGTGIAAADINGDGLIDVYFVDQLGSNKLFQNLGNGKFKDITEISHTGTIGRVSVGAAFADYDNDGDQDLFVTTIRKGTILFENTGKGIFTNVTNKDGVEYKGHPSTAIWFDYNNDGFLDLLIINVGAFTIPDEKKAKELGFYEPLSEAFLQQFKVPGEPPVLFKNNGNKTFTNVTDTANLHITDWVGAATIIDLNHDHFPDIYITSMGGENHAFENEKGESFKEVTSEYFPKTSWGAMGAKVFDYNNDGSFDLYVTDMHSDMILDHSMMKPKEKIQINKLTEDEKNELKVYLKDVDTNKLIFGNSFFENTKAGFKEISDKNGTETLWPWGISVGDVNADGYEDIFLADGMGGNFSYWPNILLINNQKGEFSHKEYDYGIEPRKNGNRDNNYFIGKGGKAYSGARSSRSAVIFDIDNDGDLDIITNEYNDFPLVLKNHLSEKKPISYLKLFLIGKTSNRNGIGSTVTLEDNKGNKQYRFVDGNSGYFGFSQLPIYFAIPNGSKIHTITIQWPSGIIQTISNTFSKNSITVEEKPK